MWSERRATLAYLASRPGGRFTFRCQPCGRHEARDASEVMAIHGEELTYGALTRRVRCKSCRMPVDGVYRTFEFSSRNDPEEWRMLGLGEGGWGSRP